MPVRMIAIVNSDPALRALFEDILFEEGYASTTYAPTDQTYYQLRLTQPDLIMVDLGLQTSWRGWLLLKLLHSDPYTAHIPILACSVDHVLIEDKRPYLQSIGCAILELPATCNEIIDAVDRMINTSSVQGYTLSPINSMKLHAQSIHSLRRDQS